VARCIAFHSYKGGTGKTTIASNFAALLAKKGYRVFLLDLDVYAPSIQAYFETKPRRWINDYLNNEAEVDNILNDMTHLINGSSTGKLWVVFANPKKEEIYKLEGGKDNTRFQLLRRFIHLREKLISDYSADYIIIDTSPGIRYWSINSLAIADTYFLALKMGDLDIDGTKKMTDDIYGSLTKHGAKSYLLLNRIAGYCMPHPRGESHPQVPEADDVAATLSKDVGMEVISAVPCYCDIQFSKKEFLTVLKYPDHPFAKQIEALADSSQIKV
jgi:MinD-like ATPase involved in chromosome partitioning or flagellar assembly